MRRTYLPPFTVQTLNRGTWLSDFTTRRRGRAFDRLAHLATSPRRIPVCRVVDRDGRTVPDADA